MASILYWLWLTLKPGLNPRQVLLLLEHFGTPEAAYFADPGEYDLLGWLSPAARGQLLDKSTDATDRVLGECDRLGQRVLTLQDAAYPDRLRQLDNPPPVLYCRGRELSFDEEMSVAVVGARKATPYGLKMAAQLGRGLAGGGALVVSGAAQGVDAVALDGALRGGGKVVSVLGNGIDVVYPPSSRGLYEDVAAAGTLLSEYPPGTEPKGSHFPVRNRVISGLSLGVVVVEGERTSGSLITARHALDQNRDVFAVPGAADARMSEGPNLLIRRGEAKLVTDARHILEEYEGRYVVKMPGREDEGQAPFVFEKEGTGRQADEKQVDKEKKPEYIDWKSNADAFTDDERDLLVALAEKTAHIDDLIEATQIPARRVLSALTMLQVRGYVEETAGRRFCAKVLLCQDGQPLRPIPTGEG